MTHSEILDLYNKTEFMVKDKEGAPHIFRVCDRPTDPVLGLKQFAIVTAWNPNNTTLSEAENRTRNANLEKAIKVLGHEYYSTVGRLGEHAEESFAIEGISERDAIQLGTDFSQYAILFNDENGPRFLFM